MRGLWKEIRKIKEKQSTARFVTAMVIVAALTSPLSCSSTNAKNSPPAYDHIADTTTHKFQFFSLEALNFINKINE